MAVLTPLYNHASISRGYLALQAVFGLDEVSGGGTMKATGAYGRSFWRRLQRGVLRSSVSVLVLLACGAAAAADAQTASMDDLADIDRSGVSSIPEMLRLAPNLQVGRIGANNYAVSSRGFNGNLANKLLVLIDGRSVYTPLFGGVYWDMQDVMRDDIARIEVISGPGATLWGANAVNGVINITTRSAADTQGGVFNLGGGNFERNISARYGGRISDDAAYRVYGKGFGRSSAARTVGGSARDKWAMGQGGFRIDWTPENDTFTVQGDVYGGSEDQRTAVDQNISGHNLLARWQHNFAGGSNLQVQGYYDRTRRFDTGGFVLQTYDLDAQYSFSLSSWNDVVVGGGYRVNHDRVFNVTGFEILPISRTLELGNVFIQDTLTLTDTLKVTLGAKLEDGHYTGVTALPSARIAWKVADNTLLWSAVSRAVRAPTRFDRDVVQKIGPTFVFLMGGANYRTEKLIAYEAGVRIEPMPELSFSLSGFYNVYDDLRSVERTPVTTFPLFFGNRIEGEVYGLEGWASYQATEWWQLTAGFNVQHQDVRIPTGSSGFEQGNDPTHQISLRSKMNVTDTVAVHADLRYVGRLPNPATPHYVELNSRLAWDVSNYLELSVAGFNLLHNRHQEFRTTGINNAIERSFMIETRWKF